MFCNSGSMKVCDDSLYWFSSSSLFAAVMAFVLVVS